MTSSIVKNRFIFRKLVQGQREKTKNWYERLFRQAKLCNFSNIFEQIFDQIVEKTEIYELRRHAFRFKMNLKDLLNLAEVFENSNEKCTRCCAKDHRYYDTSVCLAVNKKNYFHKCECIENFSLPRKRLAMESICDNQLKIIKIEPECNEMKENMNEMKMIRVKKEKIEHETIQVKEEKVEMPKSYAKSFFERHCASMSQAIKVEKNFSR